MGRVKMKRELWMVDRRWWEEVIFHDLPSTIHHLRFRFPASVRADVRGHVFVQAREKSDHREGRFAKRWRAELLKDVRFFRLRDERDVLRARRRGIEYARIERQICGRLRRRWIVRRGHF